MRYPRLWLPTLALSLALTACGDDDDANIDPAACERDAASALRACLYDASVAIAGCYLDGGAICTAADPEFAAALDTARDSVRSSCDDAAVQTAGYGPEMTAQALAERIAVSCSAESTSLAVRIYGGPQGAAWAEADAAPEACILSSHPTGLDALVAASDAYAACLDDETRCASLDDDIAEIAATAATAVDSACEDLSALVAIDAETFADRAVAQAQCATAASRTGYEQLGLECGPRDSIAQLPRGEYAQVILDSDEWGTLCGDGSEFAFQVRLAPEGFPVENLIVAMEGGGVCLFEDCASRPPSLFEALSVVAPESGIMSNDPEVSPFANWSKVYLPYCNQDVFIGGGATNTFDNGFTVHRYGAINVRAALRYVRDLIWRELDQSTEEGYRPDRMRVYFGGFSAGGFGTLYNYHYVLDDLQWARTTAFPDAALALDSGNALSVGNLGAILIPESDIGWSSLPYLPPYCFDFDCGVGPIGFAAAAPRLEAVPEQQALVLTAQVDDVQVSTTFFDSTADWVNELRFQYCELRDIQGAKFFMPALPESVHVISLRPDLYGDRPVDGETMVDWLWRGVTDPETVENRVEEGDLVEVFPGVEPFPCDIP